MAATSNMFLYSLTIQPPTTITQAIVGQFSGTKEQQILTASGSRLTLLRPDPAQGRVITLLSHDVFGIIRSIAAFRLAGSNKGTLSYYHLSLWLQLVILLKFRQKHNGNHHHHHHDVRPLPGSPRISRSAFHHQLPYQPWLTCPLQIT